MSEMTDAHRHLTERLERPHDFDGCLPCADAKLIGLTIQRDRIRIRREGRYPNDGRL